MSITKLQPFNLDSTANYTFANVTAGNVTGSNLISANYVTGTLTTAAQPNITSTGTLSNLIVSGNVALSGSNVSLGAVGNVKITGGTANYVLQTDGTGNLSWAAQTGGGGTGTSISNGTSNVNIATSNGDVTTSVNGNANVVVITGTGANVNGYASITGNVVLTGPNVSLGTVGNIKIAGGSNGQVLATDGTGNLTWKTAGSGPGGTGFLYIYTRSGTPVTVDVVSRYLNIVGRSGIIPVEIS